MKHITLLGIDGIGKSTILRQLMSDKECDFDFIASPSFHEAQALDFDELSIALEKVSANADKANSFELKSLAMYLQVSLFGNIESKLSSSKDLISFRHPVIDSMVYSDFYIKYISNELDQMQIDSLFEGVEGADLVKKHITQQLSRVGISESEIGRVPIMLKGIFSLPIKERISTLEHHFATKLPVAAIFLDLPIDIAMKRLSGRGDKGKELHETKDSLKFLISSYKNTLEDLKESVSGFKYVNFALSEDFDLSQLKEIIFMIRKDL